MPTASSSILNADDFGLHPDIDRGIVECVRAGALNSISVVVNHDFDASTLLDLQRDHGTKLGLHVTLVGEPWLSADRSFPSWKQLVPRVLVSGALRRAIAGEVAAQHARFVERLGVEPDHIDSHQHVHVFPHIWTLCFALAKQIGVRIRTPFAHRANVKRSVPGRALQRLALRRRCEALAAGLPALPCAGLAYAGHNTPDILRRELAHHPPEPIELVAHPGVNTPALQSKYASWRFDWDAERNALLSLARSTHTA